MVEVERRAQEKNCTLLLLDTLADEMASILHWEMAYSQSSSNRFYSCGATGALDATIFFFKLI